MLTRAFYNSVAWRHVRRLVLLRDDGECILADEPGEKCGGPLNVHHIEDDEELALHPENLETLCAHHHSALHWLRRRTASHDTVTTSPAAPPGHSARVAASARSYGRVYRKAAPDAPRSTGTTG